MSNATSLIPGEWIQLAVVTAVSDELIGDVGLYLEPDCSTVELGFTLARPFHGQGHATCAVLAVSELVFPFVSQMRAITDARNTSSSAVLDRTGFIKRAEQEVVFKGEPCIEYIYFKTRE